VLQQTQHRLQAQGRHRLIELLRRHETARDRLRLLGPEQVLSRGYSITLDAETGRVLREAGGTINGQRLRTRLKSGEVISRVEADNSRAGE
jgi:exodeoxyribonuclease VII large subunit